VRTAEADLILCPELFLSGYAAGEDLRRFAEPASGAGASAIAAIARETSTAIVYGYPERTGDRLYNAALAIGPDGAVLANHRKYLLPPGFESEFFAPHASGLTLFDEHAGQVISDMWTNTATIGVIAAISVLIGVSLFVWVLAKSTLSSDEGEDDEGAATGHGA